MECRRSIRTHVRELGAIPPSADRVWPHPGVAARTERSHEQRGWPRHACVPIVHRNRRTSPIDEHLLTRLVLLTQHYVELRAPTLVQLAEARRAIAIRIRLPAFFPQQLPQLLMNRGEVLLGRPTVCNWLVLLCAETVRVRHEHHPSLPATARLHFRLVSSTCIPCSPRSRSSARSGDSPDVVRMGDAAPPVVSAWTLSWPTPCSSLGGFIVPVLMSSAALPVEILPGSS